MATERTLSAVDQAIERLEWANAAFNAPETMLRRKSYVVKMRLSEEKSLEELQQELGVGGQSGGAHIHVSNRMEARLTGGTFKIQANEPEVQAVGSNGTVAWSWNVEAQEPGQQSLHLTLSAFINVAGTETPTVVRTYDQDVIVKVTAGDSVRTFVTGNWQWLWATLLVPLGPWVLTRRRKEQVAYVGKELGMAPLPRPQQDPRVPAAEDHDRTDDPRPQH